MGIAHSALNKTYSLERSESGNFELRPCDEDEVFD